MGRARHFDDRIARNNRELDARVRELVGRVRYPVTVRRAEELTSGERLTGVAGDDPA